MKVPKQEEMYVRKIYYKSLERRLKGMSRDDWYMKSFGQKPSMWAYKTKIEAFKTKLPKEEQTLSEDEIKKKYPQYEKEVDVVYTWNLMSAIETKKGNLLVKDIIGATSEAFFTCPFCEKVRHHSIKILGTYGDICKRCDTYICTDERKIKNRWESVFNEIKEEKKVVVYGKSGRWSMSLPFSLGDLLEKEGMGEWGSETEVFLMLDYAEMEKKAGTVKKFTTYLLEKLTKM